MFIVLGLVKSEKTACLGKRPRTQLAPDVEAAVNHTVYSVSGLSRFEAGGYKSAILRSFPDVFG